MDGDLTKPEPGLFMVDRSTSIGSWPGIRPCEEAFLGRALRIDHRHHISNEEELERCLTPIGVKNWYGQGDGHSFEWGHATRVLGAEDAWFVRVPDIMEFVHKYGRCIISVNDDGYNHIEIYDGYRE